jgi:hypothetical protein
VRGGGRLSAIYVRDCRVAGPAFAAPAPYHGLRTCQDPWHWPLGREPITATSQTSEASMTIQESAEHSPDAVLEARRQTTMSFFRNLRSAGSLPVEGHLPA